MMSLERWFMMTVAMGLGLLAVVAAIHNHEIYYRLPKARLIEDLGGRNAVRIAYVILGLTFIGLGVAIAWGRR
ncbi:MAG: Imm17 family immunity protein [Planctomycetota bacterium]|nr:Imm17 family immunity protein [Planctomycetota bacterium]